MITGPDRQGNSLVETSSGQRTMRGMTLKGPNDSAVNIHQGKQTRVRSQHY